MSIKVRIEESANYKAVWHNGKTLRFTIDSSKPITELKYPEFYDIKITNKCYGGCPWCYMNSDPNEEHYKDIVKKIYNFFMPMDENQRPFQVAIGGGEPTESPEFLELLRVLKEELDICPNYTTNGMLFGKPGEHLTIQAQDVLNATEKYCGGVAVSVHPHLEEYWRNAIAHFTKMQIKTNLHIIISDKKSVNYFIKIFNEFNDIISYFVLLPYSSQGRGIPKRINWEYLVSIVPRWSNKIAFGANFYPYLLKSNLQRDMNISLYEPELMSKFLDLKNMKLYRSSFNLN
jgi:hypothetical protein